ncbi:MAG: TetR/AcrR family transcriptional regulator [Proteobacteria bacterium]|uniref:TetR/AcrR family transcriptional regulator n=1 Tax=Rudaea sp. TaxID=2136325 RepID=UPI003783D444|nr:TetR/AcrR family transcriptional regulator [Pseudomonadota bacterium]
MLQAAEKAERSRLSAADWEAGALDLIAEQGVPALAVEPLARRLRVTKGSFYWHFATREALLKAALQNWETHAEEAMDQIAAIDDPRERLSELFRRTGREARTHSIYSALLRALDHPIVQPVMERVSQRRLDFLKQAYRQVGMSGIDALHRAQLTYAAYVGFLQLVLQLGVKHIDPTELEEYVEHVMSTLIPQ